MAVSSDEAVLGKFHPKCGNDATLSEDRRTASGGIRYGNSLAFSSDPIPKELKFSVKILQKGKVHVSPISAASIPHTLDAPYMAGGAVHVIHCCLLYTVMT